MADVPLPRPDPRTRPPTAEQRAFGLDTLAERMKQHFGRLDDPHQGIFDDSQTIEENMRREDNPEIPSVGKLQEEFLKMQQNLRKPIAPPPVEQPRPINLEAMPPGFDPFTKTTTLHPTPPGFNPFAKA